MNQTILTLNYLRDRFQRVEKIYSDLIRCKTMGGCTFTETQLRSFLKYLTRVVEDAMNASVTKIGSMYKAGIITGCYNAIQYLKDEYNIA